MTTGFSKWEMTNEHGRKNSKCFRAKIFLERGDYRIFSSSSLGSGMFSRLSVNDVEEHKFPVPFVKIYNSVNRQVRSFYGVPSSFFSFLKADGFITIDINFREQNTTISSILPTHFPTFSVEKITSTDSFVSQETNQPVKLTSVEIERASVLLKVIRAHLERIVHSLQTLLRLIPRKTLSDEIAETNTCLFHQQTIRIHYSSLCENVQKLDDRRIILADANSRTIVAALKHTKFAQLVQVICCFPTIKKLTHQQRTNLPVILDQMMKYIVTIMSHMTQSHVDVGRHHNSCTIY